MTDASEIARQKQEVINKADLARADSIMEAFAQAFVRDFDNSRLTDRQDAAYRALLSYRLDRAQRKKPS